MYKYQEIQENTEKSKETVVELSRHLSVALRDLVSAAESARSVHSLLRFAYSTITCTSAARFVCCIAVVRVNTKQTDCLNFYSQTQMPVLISNTYLSLIERIMCLYDSQGSCIIISHYLSIRTQTLSEQSYSQKYQLYSYIIESGFISNLLGLCEVMQIFLFLCTSRRSWRPDVDPLLQTSSTCRNQK